MKVSYCNAKGIESSIKEIIYNDSTTTKKYIKSVRDKDGQQIFYDFFPSHVIKDGVINSSKEIADSCFNGIYNATRIEPSGEGLLSITKPLYACVWQYSNPYVYQRLVEDTNNQSLLTITTKNNKLYLSYTYVDENGTRYYVQDIDLQVTPSAAASSNAYIVMLGKRSYDNGVEFVLYYYNNSTNTYQRCAEKILDYLPEFFKGDSGNNIRTNKDYAPYLYQQKS